jgi:two-component system OmpR family response regulator
MSEPASHPSVHVLVVDDNAEVRAMLCALLAEEGIRTSEASGSEDALNHVIAGPFDAAVVDLVMPGTNGILLLVQIRACRHGSLLPVAVLSTLPDGATREAARLQCTRIPRVEFVDKPVTGRRLVAVLGALLASA